ncbi:hypothetical protein [Streptomyces sp. NPDC048436]|uniref:hypothetical protein n=1 Tax=Streptomyces sp. NPDC048436 TaxID=3365550 RepID=UPI00371F8224
MSAKTVVKLREAQVSHAAVHRAETILAEWDAKVARPVLRAPGGVQRDEAIADLREQLSKAKARVTEVQGRLDALPTVAANLYAENLALKTKLGSRKRLAVIPSQDG